MKKPPRHVDGSKATLRRLALAGDRDALATLIHWERDDARVATIRLAARELRDQARRLLTMPLA